MKRYLFLSIMLFSLVLLGQEGGSFKKVWQYTVKGGCRIVGNNIVSTDPVKAYNEVGYHAEKNDRLSMVYVDVDDNDNTFSSSSANLELPESVEKIVKATLYWTATYTYEKGDVKRERTEYLYTEEVPRVDNFNNILFKTPNAAYINLSGVLVEDQKDSIGRPYLCYADVTTILNQAENKSGTYTIANMRASQGHILGGSSGGWVLVVIYENKEEPLKQIDIYQGFKSANKSFFKIGIDQRSDNKTANTTLYLGVLEGDERLKTDRLTMISDAENKNKLPVYSKVRPRNNFFNSTITNEDETVNDRKPNSINTLGFDLATIDITKYIKNKKGKFELEFNSIRDKFLLFFMGVELEVDEEKKNEMSEQVVAKDTTNQPLDELVVKESKRIEGVSSGYYLITNVFSDEKLAEKWRQHLKNLGFVPQTLTTPKNNWQYVYVSKGKNKSDCYQMYLTLKKKNEFKNVWLLEVLE